jgi:hypothetical protein
VLRYGRSFESALGALSAAHRACKSIGGSGHRLRGGPGGADPRGSGWLRLLHAFYIRLGTSGSQSWLMRAAIGIMIPIVSRHTLVARNRNLDAGRQIRVDNATATPIYKLEIEFIPFQDERLYGEAMRCRAEPKFE